MILFIVIQAAPPRDPLQRLDRPVAAFRTMEAAEECANGLRRTTYQDDPWAVGVFSLEMDPLAGLTPAARQIEAEAFAAMERAAKEPRKW